ncbi:hypothetical protein ABZV34_32310 [Streptomyces sp. NPDC005195]|uniref:hypothetical protein n=1 Tax=Streptomyces sp. NPDC005195 TaxID=3154561 RepID=UPI0033B09B14
MRSVPEPVRAMITDVVVEGAYTGPALLRSCAPVPAPPADLPGLEVLPAGHILTDPDLAPVEPVFDHLKEGAQ